MSFDHVFVDVNTGRFMVVILIKFVQDRAVSQQVMHFLLMLFFAFCC